MIQEVWQLVAPSDLAEVVNVCIQKQVNLVLGEIFQKIRIGGVGGVRVKGLMVSSIRVSRI